jgi:hypothetical protein
MSNYVPIVIELYINRNIGRLRNITEEVQLDIDKYNELNSKNYENYIRCTELNRGHNTMINQIACKNKEDVIVTIKCLICGYIQVDL